MQERSLKRAWIEVKPAGDHGAIEQKQDNVENEKDTPQGVQAVEAKWYGIYGISDTTRSHSKTKPGPGKMPYTLFKAQIPPLLLNILLLPIRHAPLRAVPTRYNSACPRISHTRFMRLFRRTGIDPLVGIIFLLFLYRFLQANLLLHSISQSFSWIARALRRCHSKAWILKWVLVREVPMRCSDIGMTAPLQPLLGAGG
jgi:hypothetical protein